MTVSRFTDAIVRQPARSAVRGLRAVDRGKPNVAALQRQHLAYCAVLERAGVLVHTLPAIEDFPDSLFVEDPALVFGEAAIVLRPGAASRFGEAAALRDELHLRFPTVLELPGPGFVDGGDVLVTPDCIFIGLSARTDRAGAEALVEQLSDLGRESRIVTPPPGVLHLKSACSLLDETTLLATKTLADSGVIEGLAITRVADGEEPAANALRINDSVLLPAGYPRTADRLRALGYTLEILVLDHVERLDAGLSCMSLRWARAPVQP